jgi:hypothetical protein
VPFRFKTPYEVVTFLRDDKLTRFGKVNMIWVLREGEKGSIMVLPWNEYIWVPEYNSGGIEVINMDWGIVKQCKEDPNYTFARLLEVWWHLTPELYREQTGRDLEYVSKINVGW